MLTTIRVGKSQITVSQFYTGSTLTRIEILYKLYYYIYNIYYIYSKFCGVVFIALKTNCDL